MVLKTFWRSLHNSLKDLTIYKLKGVGGGGGRVSVIVSECHMLADCKHRNCIIKAKPPLGNHVRKNPGEKTLPTSLHQWLIKRGFFKSLFLLRLLTFFSFKTERCSNPLFIVRVVWDWPREIAFWWQWSVKRALPKRASEVNGPVSMLTVKSWLEPSGASESLSSSAFLKIIFKGKNRNDNVKNKRDV